MNYPDDELVTLFNRSDVDLLELAEELSKRLDARNQSLKKIQVLVEEELNE